MLTQKQKDNMKTPNILKHNTKRERWFYDSLMFRVVSRSSDGWAAIPYQTIHSIGRNCGIRNCSSLLDLFISNKLIDCDNFYAKGQCRRYRPHNDFLESYDQATYIDPDFSEPTFDLRIPSKDEGGPSDRSWKNNIRPYYQKPEINWKPLPGAFEALEAIKNPVTRDCYYSILMGRRYLVPHATRVYSSFASLPKEIKRHVTLNGESLMELDIHALHPSLIVNHMPDSAEKEMLKGFISTGDFYNHLSLISGVSLKETKTASLITINKATEKKLAPCHRKVETALKKNFPQYYSFLCDKKKNDHRDISKWLFKKEFQLMNQWVKQASKITDVLSCHDAIWVPGSWAEDTASIGRELGKDFYFIK